MNEHGTSLVEVLVTLALSAVVATLGVSFARSTFSGMARHESAAAAQQAAAIALDVMTRDIELAGFALADSGIRSAQEASIQLASDLNADGDILDANERTTYSFNRDKEAITRASGNGSPQPFLRGVASLLFRYVSDPDDSALIRNVNIDIALDETGGQASRLRRTASLRKR